MFKAFFALMATPGSHELAVGISGPPMVDRPRWGVEVGTPETGVPNPSRSLGPAVGIADRDHRGQDVVPGTGLHHHFVGEHAPVPADVAGGPGDPARLVT